MVKKYEFPLIEGTENEVAIDINKLRDVVERSTMDQDIKIQVHVLVKLLFLMVKNSSLQRIFNEFSRKSRFS
jgi:hypothetical protein